jgi:hypothetical protein
MKWWRDKEADASLLSISVDSNELDQWLKNILLLWNPFGNQIFLQNP